MPVAHAGTNASILDTTWRGIIIGAGMGMCFQSFPNIALSEVPRAKLGVSSGIFNTFRQLGFVLGVAILISLFVGQVQVNVPQATSRAIQIVQQDTAIPAQYHAFIIKGLQQASANTNSSNFQAQSYDLAQFANNAPPQYRAQVRANLQALSHKIAAQFNQALLQSFETTWLAAALGSVFGLILSFVTLVFRRKKPGAQASASVASDVEEIPAVL